MNEYKHGEELRSFWRIQKQKYRTNKAERAGLPELTEEDIPIIAYVLAITEDEEKIWILKNLCKRGI